MAIETIKKYFRSYQYWDRKDYGVVVKFSWRRGNTLEIDVNDELLNEKYKNYYLDINKNFEDIVFYKSDDNGKWIEKNFMR